MVVLLMQFLTEDELFDVDEIKELIFSAALYYFSELKKVRSYYYCFIIIIFRKHVSWECPKHM